MRATQGEELFLKTLGLWGGPLATIGRLRRRLEAEAEVRQESRIK